MLSFLAFAAIVATAQAGTCPGITCRCYDGQSKYPTYPSILSCKIPNSDEWVVTFCEEDDTWNPQHEFPAGPGQGPFQYAITGGQPDAQGANECPGGKPCQTLKSVADPGVKSGYFICSLISPKCWYDPGRVENTVWNGKYGCADNDHPKPAKSGASCPMTCAAGFKMQGKPPVCSGGKWIKFPKCAPAGCGKPPSTGVGKWKIDPASDCAKKQGPYPKGTTCNVICPKGWNSNEDLVCDVSKGKPTWDLPSCIKPTPKTCTGPFKPAPKNGKFNCKKVKHGGKCPLHCASGFEPAGQLPTCNNGAWVEPGDRRKAHCKCKEFQHIDTNTPLACVFGGFSGIERLDFVVDVSGSMLATMKVGGTSISRIAYLKKALSAAIDSLDDDQYFNIIKYSTTASAWKSGVVKATAANEKAGKQYAASLSAAGGTNMHQGLTVAAKDKTVEGVFVLTDGQPTLYGSPARKESTKYPYKRIQDMVTGWKKNKKSSMAKIKLFPISFMAPKKYWPKLQWLADQTGGKFHKIV